MNDLSYATPVATEIYSRNPAANLKAFCAFLSVTGRLSPAALERSERLAVEEGQSFAATLISLGLIADRDLADAYAAFLGIETLRQDALPEKSMMFRNLNAHFLKEYRLVPIELRADHMSIAMSDPLDDETVAAVRFAVQKPVRIFVASVGDIDECLERLYGDGAAHEPQSLSEGLDDFDNGDIDRLRDSASVAPVIRIVNQLIARAVEVQASDIHFEPAIDGLDVRYRIDGILRNVEPPPGRLRAAIISRLKIMSNLDIAERRLAQDGRMTLAIRGRDIDFRISTMPTLHGESVVLRILDRAGLTLELPALGFSDGALEAWGQAIAKPRGIVLVTGPTGSGKTTTLYASVLEIADRGRKVLTIEDPIEYKLPMINQTQIKPAVNLTFANALRSSLRHDPDIMMIGEIRDLETARIAVQAALTGHLILSTLHTNDAASAVTRLIDIGIEPYLLTSTINAVAAQRLVRLLCTHCCVDGDMQPGMVHALGLRSSRVKIAAGCAECGGTGYRGRTALMEVLSVTSTIKQLILKQADADEIQAAAVAEGMRTMRQHGLALIEAGLTSPEEIFRVSADT